MLEKIKEFFRNLFKTNEQLYIEAPKEEKVPINNINEKRNINFKNEIVVDNKEENRSLKLQKNFKAGLINEEDLSEEEFNLLRNLYEKQIEETKKSIQRYKEKIIAIKTELAQN